MVPLPDEKAYVEIPFIEQLKGLGWEHIEGDIDVPYLTERESFREVLLRNRLKKAVMAINRDEEGRPWLDEDRVSQIVSAVERISEPKLMEANRAAFDLIAGGFPVSGGVDGEGGREKAAKIIDFDHPERNDFLAINQFGWMCPAARPLYPRISFSL
jgi:type I restriction enzyme R subunit